MTVYDVNSLVYYNSPGTFLHAALNAGAGDTIRPVVSGVVQVRSNQLHINSGVHVDGSEANFSLQSHADYGGDLFSVADSEDVILENIRLRMVGANNARALRANDSINLTVRNVSISGWSDSAITPAGAVNLTIEDCMIWGPVNGWGYFMESAAGGLLTIRRSIIGYSSGRGMEGGRPFAVYNNLFIQPNPCGSFKSDGIYGDLENNIAYRANNATPAQTQQFVLVHISEALQEPVHVDLYRSGNELRSFDVGGAVTATNTTTPVQTEDVDSSWTEVFTPYVAKPDLLTLAATAGIVDTAGARFDGALDAWDSVLINHIAALSGVPPFDAVTDILSTGYPLGIIEHEFADGAAARVYLYIHAPPGTTTTQWTNTRSGVTALNTVQSQAVLPQQFVNERRALTLPNEHRIWDFEVADANDFAETTLGTPGEGLEGIYAAVQTVADSIMPGAIVEVIGYGDRDTAIEQAYAWMSNNEAIWT